tara:strand:+ start:1305 stop:1556 length:252 start_codon:yes stop_codon:yes gene_type:complete
MALSAEHKSALAEQYGYDSSENIVLFRIENATEEKIAGRFTNSNLNHPKSFGTWAGSVYTGVATWEDSAGEIQLSADCEEVTQ